MTCSRKGGHILSQTLNFLEILTKNWRMIIYLSSDGFKSGLTYRLEA